MIVSTADALPIGAAICGANKQDATFTAEALASVVAEIPLHAEVIVQPPEPPERDEKSRVSKSQRRAAAAFRDAATVDWRALPFNGGDGNFAKDTARADAKPMGLRL